MYFQLPIKLAKYHLKVLLIIYSICKTFAISYAKVDQLSKGKVELLFFKFIQLYIFRKKFRKPSI